MCLVSDMCLVSSHRQEDAYGLIKDIYHVLMVKGKICVWSCHRQDNKFAMLWIETSSTTHSPLLEHKFC